MTRTTAAGMVLAALFVHADIQVESSMPTERGHGVESVADGNRESWFQSTRPPRKGDAITVRLGNPQKLTGIHVLTGSPDGRGHFDGAGLEVSGDGSEFHEIASLLNGEAKWPGNGRPVAAIRLRCLKDGNAPVAVREIAMDDEVLRRVVVSLQGKAPFGNLTAKCNFSEVPADYAVLMRDRLDIAAGWFFKYYPEIVRMLEAPTEGLQRDLEIRFSDTIKPGVPGYVSGGKMTLSIPHVIRHPVDVRGLFIHELTHVVQSYGGPGERPGWLVEGLAEAVRYELSPADDPWRRAVDGIDPARVDYRKAYRETAPYLLWIKEQGHPRLLAELNRAMKDGAYNEETWTRLTGRSPDAWLEAYRKSKGR